MLGQRAFAKMVGTLDISGTLVEEAGVLSFGNVILTAF